MSDPTFIACPHCGEPVVMTAMQHDLYRGRAIACARCGKQFTVDAQRTPLFTLSAGGRVYVSSPPPSETSIIQTPAAPAPTIEPTAPPPAPRTTIQSDSVAPSWRLPAMVFGGALLVVLIMGALVWPSANAARGAQQQLNCASNLRQIGIALQIYASTHNNRYPDTLARLVSSSLVTPEVLVCPATAHTPAPGTGPQAQAANVSDAHCSYVYLGAGLTTSAALNQQTIILHEPMSNHGSSKGTHVLYANGAVAFLPPGVAQQTLATLTTNPTPAPSTRDAP